MLEGESLWSIYPSSAMEYNAVTLEETDGQIVAFAPMFGLDSRLGLLTFVYNPPHVEFPCIHKHRPQNRCSISEAGGFVKMKKFLTMSLFNVGTIIRHPCSHDSSKCPSQKSYSDLL